MRISLIAVVPFAALAACSGGGSSSDAGTGTDGGTQSGACSESHVEFTGNVIYDPVELACRGLPPTWTSTGTCTNGGASSAMGNFDGGMTLADAGTAATTDGGGLVCGTTPNPPPCLNGDTFRVEDAIRALNNLAPLNTEPMMSGGTFDVAGVNVQNTTLALIGTVVDPSNDPTQGGNILNGLAFSGYGLGKPCFYDSKAAGQTSNSSGLPVYVASSAFGQLIAKAIGQDYSAMLAQGAVIAHVTDISGTQGVSGFQLVNVYGSGANENFPVVSNAASPTIYMNDDLTSGTDITTDAAASTGAQGVIIRLNAGSAAEYTVAAVGDTAPAFKYEHHLNGSRPGTILEVFFRHCESTTQEGCH